MSLETARQGSGNSYTAPEPYIPIGQGFFVIGSGAGGGTITFNNAQREYKQEGEDAIFYKNGGSTGANVPQLLKLGLDYMHQEENTMFHRQIGISFLKVLFLDMSQGMTHLLTILETQICTGNLRETTLLMLLREFSS